MEDQNLHVHISSLFNLGETRPSGGRMQREAHRWYLDFTTRLLEITDRLKKIIRFAAVGSFG